MYCCRFFSSLSLFLFLHNAVAFERQDSLGLSYGHSAVAQSSETSLITTSFAQTFYQEQAHRFKQNRPSLTMHYTASLGGPSWLVGLDQALCAHFIEKKQVDYSGAVLNVHPGNAPITPALTTRYFGSYHLALLTGYKPHKDWTLFVRGGPALTLFHSDSSAGTLGSGGMLGYSGRFSRLVPGMMWGAGLSVSIRPQWQLRADYSKSRISFDKRGVEPASTYSNLYYGSSHTQYHVHMHTLSLGLMHLFQ